MTEKKGIYDTCKAKVRTIQEAYDALIDAVEDYKVVLTGLIDEADPNEEYDKHLLVVANLQPNTANGLLGILDTALHDDLTRLSTLVIHFKHTTHFIFL